VPAIAGSESLSHVAGAPVTRVNSWDSAHASLPGKTLGDLQPFERQSWARFASFHRSAWAEDQTTPEGRQALNGLL
jgi:hypothetical protein